MLSWAFDCTGFILVFLLNLMHFLRRKCFILHIQITKYIMFTLSLVVDSVALS